MGYLFNYISFDPLEAYLCVIVEPILVVYGNATGGVMWCYLLKQLICIMYVIAYSTLDFIVPLIMPAEPGGGGSVVLSRTSSVIFFLQYWSVPHCHMNLG